MLRKAMVFLTIAVCLAGAGSQAGRAQTGDDNSQPLPGQGINGVLSASSACSLDPTQYTMEVNEQGPCGTTYTEVSIFSDPKVRLYVRFGQRVEIIDGRVIADYKAESETAFKRVLLAPPHLGGTYYVAVANCGAGPASFSLGFGVAIADYFGPFIKEVTIKGKKLMVHGCGFHEESLLYLNGKEQQTDYTTRSEMPTLVAKKSGKKIPRGVTVFLQIQDANGRLSEPFPYTRPEE